MMYNINGGLAAYAALEEKHRMRISPLYCEFVDMGLDTREWISLWSVMSLDSSKGRVVATSDCMDAGSIFEISIPSSPRMAELSRIASWNLAWATFARI